MPCSNILEQGISATGSLGFPGIDGRARPASYDPRFNEMNDLRGNGFNQMGMAGQKLTEIPPVSFLWSSSSGVRV